jgi:Skp family chaperone for outer membrane proteins
MHNNRSPVAVIALVLSVLAVVGVSILSVHLGRISRRQLTIGFVDTAIVREGATIWADADRRIGETVGRHQAALDQMEQELRALDRMIEDGEVGAGTIRSQRETRLRDYEDYVQAASRDVERIVAEESEPVLAKVNAAIRRYGDERGYDLILGATEAGSVLYGSDVSDVTADFIEYLNTEAAESVD